jgi:chromosomal replication initiation ATPase DnaA
MKQLHVNINHLPPDKLAAIEDALKTTGVEYQYDEKNDTDILLDALREVLNVTLDELKSHKKGKKLSYARRIYFYYAHRIYPNLSQKNIGKMINKKQVSVSCSIAKFYNDNSRYNPEFRAYVKSVDEYLNSSKK